MEFILHCLLYILMLKLFFFFFFFYKDLKAQLRAMSDNINKENVTEGGGNNKVFPMT